MSRLVGLMLLGSLLSACTFVDNNPPPVGSSYPYPNGSGRGVVPPGTLGYHVLANASTSIPGGDLGYLVTANGQGGYRITWTDTLGSAAYFHGSAFTTGTFQSYTSFAGLAYLTPSGSPVQRVDFSSQPFTAVHGLDLVSSTDPIYVDLLIDGRASGVNIFFTNADDGLVSVSQTNPVSFTSP